LKIRWSRLIGPPRSRLGITSPPFGAFWCMIQFSFTRFPSSLYFAQFGYHRYIRIRLMLSKVRPSPTSDLLVPFLSTWHTFHCTSKYLTPTSYFSNLIQVLHTSWFFGYWVNFWSYIYNNFIHIFWSRDVCVSTSYATYSNTRMTSKLKQMYQMELIIHKIAHSKTWPSPISRWPK